MSDLPSDEFRAAAHRVADLMADYLEGSERYPVLPPIQPGAVRERLPSSPPAAPEPLERILDDYKALIEPNLTHWNHPGFMGYFAISGSAPGVLGEALAAALNVNAMLWKTSPAATELEELCCDWLRQMLGLPEPFLGHINDTASVSTFLSLAAARHRAPGLDLRGRGLFGAPPLIVYASEHAHSSIDKAMLALGLGLEQLRKIPTDAHYALDAAKLEGAIEADRQAGYIPIAVVATVGSTSTSAIDPVPAIAQICKKAGLWLHVDASYAGSAAVCPELRHRFQGWEAADSIVVNPHKWLFTPIDCSVLFLREPSSVKSAFSLLPEYLKTPELGSVNNLMDYGIQLGRRFRALKLWMVIRAFGVDGLAARIREHCALAREFAAWVEADPRFELLAPVPFSLVCFRLRADDATNERVLAQVNAEGPVFLSHTRLGGRFALRLAIGNIRTEKRHMEAAWALLRTAATLD